MLGRLLGVVCRCVYALSQDWYRHHNPSGESPCCLEVPLLFATSWGGSVQVSNACSFRFAGLGLGQQLYSLGWFVLLECPVTGLISAPQPLSGVLLLVSNELGRVCAGFQCL
jgi:hypothetical protein